LEIVVIGIGYVGIPTAALFANGEGFNVIWVQRRSKRSRWEIVYLNAAKCPLGSDEPCLIELIEKGMSESSFRVTDDFSVCMKADVILIDVQTPVDEPHIPQSKGTKDLLVVEGVPLDNILRVSKADLLKIDAVGS